MACGMEGAWRMGVEEVGAAVAGRGVVARDEDEVCALGAEAADGDLEAARPDPVLLLLLLLEPPAPELKLQRRMPVLLLDLPGAAAKGRGS